MPQRAHVACPRQVALLHSLFVYLVRRRKIARGDKEGYEATYGPPLLVVAVVTAMAMYLTGRINKLRSAATTAED